MAKFIILYKGNATPPENMTAEQSAAIMGKWAEWMQKVGSKMVDMGQPMKPDGVSVVDDGSAGGQVTPLNGYSVIEAETMDEAKQLVADHPFLSDKSGGFSVEVYELMPVPEMSAA